MVFLILTTWNCVPVRQIEVQPIRFENAFRYVEPIRQKSRYFNPAFSLTSCECVQSTISNEKVTSPRFTHRFPIAKIYTLVSYREVDNKDRNS